MFPATAIFHLHLDLHARGLYDGYRSVVDLSQPGSAASREPIDHLYRSYGLDVDTAVDPTIDDLYRIFGFQRHNILDRDGSETHLGQNLNKPLFDESLRHSFDLVTDHGVSQHVFVFDEIYRTMHRLCRPGGMIVVWNSFWGGSGYNSPIPEIFEDLAAVNNYDILFSSFEVNGYFIPIGSRINEFVPQRARIGFCYALRKTRDKEFVAPYQHQLTRQTLGIVSFDEEFFVEPMGRRYLPITIEQTQAKISTNQTVQILFDKLAKRLNPF